MRGLDVALLTSLIYRKDHGGRLESSSSLIVQPFSRPCVLAIAPCTIGLSGLSTRYEQLSFSSKDRMKANSLEAGRGSAGLFDADSVGRHGDRFLVRASVLLSTLTKN